MVEYVFNKLDLDWRKHVKTDKKFERPEELNYLRGDSRLARNLLGWKPKYTFESMMDEMIEYWLQTLHK